MDFNNDFYGKEIDQETRALKNAFERSADTFEYYPISDSFTAINSGSDTEMVIRIVATSPRERPLAFLNIEVEGDEQMVLARHTVATPPAGSMAWEISALSYKIINASFAFLNVKFNFSITSNTPVTVSASVVRRLS